MFKKLSVTLSEPEAQVFATLAGKCPGVSEHTLHLAVFRYGLRVFVADHKLLVTELRQITRDRRAARRGEVAP